MTATTDITHGRACTCRPCLTVKFNMRQDRPDVALNAAIAAGIITDRHIEHAWLTNIDPLRIAGYGTPLSATERHQLDSDPDHELRAAMAEIHRLRTGIRAEARNATINRCQACADRLNNLLGPTGHT